MFFYSENSLLSLEEKKPLRCKIHRDFINQYMSHVVSFIFCSHLFCGCGKNMRDKNSGFQTQSGMQDSSSSFTCLLNASLSHGCPW